MNTCYEFDVRFQSQALEDNAGNLFAQMPRRNRPLVRRL
jgi:hypothetical protein